MNPSDNIFHDAVLRLLTEIFEGPPGNEAYILNPGDPGFLRQLDRISSDAASTLPIRGKSSIAAHAHHVHFGIGLLVRWARGEPNPWADADWEASWRRTTVSEEEWQLLRERLRTDFEAWRTAAATRKSWDGLTAAGAIASVAHTAYHLGAIRQIVAATQDRGAMALP